VTRTAIAMERAQLTYARGLHITIEEEMMQAGVFCGSAPRLCFLYTVVRDASVQGRQFEGTTE
jgi:hypothetical protein